MGRTTVIFGSDKARPCPISGCDGQASPGAAVCLNCWRLAPQPYRKAMESALRTLKNETIQYAYDALCEQIEAIRRQGALFLA